MAIARKTARKASNRTLPEVKKPAGYGNLVSVLNLDGDVRELWFQHDETVRVIRVKAPGTTLDEPVTILTKGKRESHKKK